MMRKNDSYSQVERIKALFNDNQKSEIILESANSGKKCEAHSIHRRRSSVTPDRQHYQYNLIENLPFKTTFKNDIIRRPSNDSVAHDKFRKRLSWCAANSKSIEHPSAFPSLLRTTVVPNKKSTSYNNNMAYNRRASTSALNEIGNGWKKLDKNTFFQNNISSNLNNKQNNSVESKLKFLSLPKNDFIRDYICNESSRPTSILSNKNIENLKNNLTKENLVKHVTILQTDVERPRTRTTSTLSDESCKSRCISMDSLEMRRNSMDYMEKGISHLNLSKGEEKNRPQFIAVSALTDSQAVRCAEFHPNGKIYAVGSNSKTLRICEYPELNHIREEHTVFEPNVLFKRTKHHKGSIYCISWSPDGELLATGSNDKTIKLMRYDDFKHQLEGQETELTMHDGTVRDLCFLEDSTNKSSLLISGGAGDCKIYVTDCDTSTPFMSFPGHSGQVLSIYNWGGAIFVSGSHDKTIRFWDLRTRSCINTITPTTNGYKQGSSVAAVCVDPSGRLLVSGHEDSSCILYDIRGNRPIQCFKPHSADIRSIRFSPSAYYLLTAGYDNKLVLTDLQGDLTLPLPSISIAHHNDKVISGRWHPTDFSFLSTSADKTAKLWALPPI